MSNVIRRLQANARARTCARILAVAIACSMGKPGSAQVSGRFLGTVASDSGVALPNARVTLRNSHTGSLRETKTNELGAFEILAVPAADGYAITAEAGGFEKIEETELKLVVNQDFRINFKLETGTAAAPVEVPTAPVQVESDSTQLGEVIETRNIEALPLDGRSYLDLLGLQAGVTPTSNPSPFWTRRTTSTRREGNSIATSLVAAWAGRW
jgi:hypothetical protein